MSDEIREEYLWDKSGPPDPEVQRLERLLGGKAYRPRKLVLPPAEARRRFRLGPLLAAAAAVAVLLFGARSWLLNARDYYRVDGVAGVERLHVGERLETGDGEATVYVASIGDVRVAPRSRLRAETIEEGSHHLFLERGRISASILAKPHVFQVGTPAGWSIDLGCEYDLEVGEDGLARLTVHTGRVAFEAGGRRVILPRGFWCETAPGGTPSVPVAVDAPAALVEAVRAIERAAAPSAAHLAVVTDPDATPIRDHSVTLWHLFVFGEAEATRDAVYDVLSRVYPLPAGFSEAQLKARDEEALRAWLPTVRRDWPGGWFQKTLDWFYGPPTH